jgi:hypothetical protein
MEERMAGKRKESLACPQCNSKVRKRADFCPHCGHAFVAGLKCINHKGTSAAGVCIICSAPFCKECGSRVNKLFLCSEHAGYEIYEGMARVLGMSDELAAKYALQCLEQVGLHPLLYSRKASPISLGAGDYTLFEASGEYDGHIINEVKVMVPCPEVLKAERVLKDLKLATTRKT